MVATVCNCIKKTFAKTNLYQRSSIVISRKINKYPNGKKVVKFTK